MKKAFFTLALLLTVAPLSAGNCEVLLNEIMADPASDWNGDGSYTYRDDEWIEIVNSGPASVDLGDYYLGDEAGGLVYGFSGSLGPSEVRVVYGSDAVDWESAHGESSTGLRLGNDGDTATLWQVAGPDTMLVDAYTYNTQEAEDDRSTGRMPDGASNWEIFDALNPYPGSGPPAGNGLAPTPGQSNGAAPSPVSETTWGKIKASFRGHAL
jgi:hypothetical protein